VTRRSKRELERSIEELSTDDEEHPEIVLHDTVIGTDWEPPEDDGWEHSDLDSGEQAEETTVIEL
jgi:hypothetical protein